MNVKTTPVLTKDTDKIRRLNNDLKFYKKSLAKLEKQLSKIELKSNLDSKEVLIDELKKNISLAKENIERTEKEIEYLENNDVVVYKYKHLTKREVREQVVNAAKILDLVDYLDRKPSALSGGQCQRVALGRAIVRNSKLFLMDEPLSNLDAKLRVQMRSEIVKLHNQLQTTTIYVTHDQTEAMTMASRIVVMNKGYIQQIGTPIEVYNKPANTFVASFIGAPAMNLLNVTYKDGIITFSDGNTLTLTTHYLKEKDLPEEFILGIRPENIKTTFKEDKDSYPVEIQVAELLGREYYVHTLFGGIDLVSNTEVNEKLSMHDKCFIKIDKEKLHFFNKDTQMRI